MRTKILGALLLAACTRPNPGFDGSSASTSHGDASTGTTGAPPLPTTSAGTSGAASSTGPADPTQSIDSDSAGTSSSSTTHAVDDTSGSTTGTTDAATTGTTADTDTGSSTDTDTDTDTDGESGCWAQGASGWPLAGAPLDMFADKAFADPFISFDGLQLYYIALDPRRPFRSTRADLMSPFPNGKQLALWNNDTKWQPGYPNVVLAGQEMLLSNEGDVYSSKYDIGKDQFGTPALLKGASMGGDEGVITATSDGATLIVTRRDGPVIMPLFPDSSFRFHQLTRNKVEPGGDFVDPNNDVTPIVAPLGVALCPAVSPDGLHLFFASTDQPVLDKSNVNDAVGIFYTSRPSREDKWDTATKIDIVHAGKGVTCPSSVTADGCQLAYLHFQFGAEDNYMMNLAVRSP